MGRFEKRTAVVIGTGNQIGAACAERLTAEGAVVVPVDTDAVDGRALEPALRRCERNGAGVSVLVNCHMARDWRSIEDSDLDAWAEAYRINLLGPVACSNSWAMTWVRAITPPFDAEYVGTRGLPVLPVDGGRAGLTPGTVQ